MFYLKIYMFYFTRKEFGKKIDKINKSYILKIDIHI